jgi:hypothetical protein
LKRLAAAKQGVLPSCVRNEHIYWPIKHRLLSRLDGLLGTVIKPNRQHLTILHRSF